MSDRFFLETNIFVYSFDKNAPRKADRAATLIRRAIDAREGIVSYLVVQEFFNLALRRFAEPMSGAEAEQYLSTTFRPLLAVHSSYVLYGQALQLGDYAPAVLVRFLDRVFRNGRAVPHSLQ